jgi:hypothetical protein
MSASTAKCKIVVKSPPFLRLLLPTNYMMKRTEKMSGMKIRHLSYVPGEEPGIENPETIYNIYRDYIKHEDELINRRLLSNIILQGFLFAAFGFSIEFLRRSTVDGLPANLRFLPFVFPLVGCAVGVLALMSIVAAQEAIDGLKKDWEHIALAIDPRILVRLPGLTGAGQKRSNSLGKMPQVGIACVIIIAWVAVWWITRR